MDKKSPKSFQQCLGGGWNPPPDVPPNGGTSPILTQNVIHSLKTTKLCLFIQIWAREISLCRRKSLFLMILVVASALRFITHFSTKSRMSCATVNAVGGWAFFHWLFDILSWTYFASSSVVTLSIVLFLGRQLSPPQAIVWQFPQNRIKEIGRKYIRGAIRKLLFLCHWRAVFMCRCKVIMQRAMEICIRHIRRHYPLMVIMWAVKKKKKINKNASENHEAFFVILYEDLFIIIEWWWLCLLIVFILCCFFFEWWGDDMGFDSACSFANYAQFMGSTFWDIEAASGFEWSTIIDAYNHWFSIYDILHIEQGAEW